MTRSVTEDVTMEISKQRESLTYALESLEGLRYSDEGMWKNIRAYQRVLRLQKIHYMSHSAISDHFERR